MSLTLPILFSIFILYLLSFKHMYSFSTSIKLSEIKQNSYFLTLCTFSMFFIQYPNMNILFTMKTVFPVHKNILLAECNPKCFVLILLHFKSSFFKSLDNTCYPFSISKGKLPNILSRHLPLTIL